MVTYADSSFLLAMYVNDDHMAAAHAYLEKNPYPLCLTPFAKSEMRHALRLMAFRGDISRQLLTQHLLLFEQDQADGIFLDRSFEVSELFQQAEQLSQRYASMVGICYLDMLHLACALTGNAKRFLSFDDRQRKLARAVGLEIKP